MTDSIRLCSGSSNFKPPADAFPTHECANLAKSNVSPPVGFYFTLINLRSFAYTMREDNAARAIIAMQLRRFPRPPRLPAKMSMLIADRFINSRIGPAWAFVWPRAGLMFSPPLDATFNYPADRARSPRGECKRFPPPSCHPLTIRAARARSRTNDSFYLYPAIDPVIVDSTRYAVVVPPGWRGILYCRVYQARRSRAGTNRPRV